MRKRGIIVIAFAVAIGLPSVGRAQNSGTQAEQDACTPDVFSLCEEFIPNEGPIVACLKAKRRQLSRACALVMFPASAVAGKSVRPRHAAKKHRSHAR